MKNIFQQNSRKAIKKREKISISLIIMKKLHKKIQFLLQKIHKFNSNKKTKISSLKKINKIIIINLHLNKKKLVP